MHAPDSSPGQGERNYFVATHGNLLLLPFNLPNTWTGSSFHEGEFWLGRLGLRCRINGPDVQLGIRSSLRVRVSCIADSRLTRTRTEVFSYFDLDAQSRYRKRKQCEAGCELRKELSHASQTPEPLHYTSHAGQGTATYNQRRN